MATLIIKNLGPIVEAELDLKKVNVFMGPQSSGKSTIVKVLSTCRWIEKQLCLDKESVNGFDLKQSLIDFHRFDENYFKEETLIEFVSDVVKIHYSNRLNTQIGTDAGYYDLLLDKVSKISYIPAERNLVSVLPNIIKYADKKDNLQSFLFDWFDARQKHPAENSLDILNLDARYYYSASNNESDYVQLADGNKFQLQNASSGLQSVIPLVLMISYVTREIYENGVVGVSYQYKNTIAKILSRLQDELKFLENVDNENVDKYKDRLDYYKKVMKGMDVESLNGIFENKRNIYTFSQLIIEEPEQNLYPETQKDLIYSLISAIQYNELKHQLSLTTHSPYVLYALNNCMLHYLVRNTASERTNDKYELIPMINPQEVAVYEIAGGIVRCIQNEQGLIGKNFLDGIMKAIMNEFYYFLERYED